MHSFSSSATAFEWRHSSTIGLELDELNQLFNSLDLSPIQNKDLSPEVEEFIVGSAQEHAPGEALTLRIRVGKWPGQDPSDLIRQSIHNYFAYRAQMNHLEFRRLMKRGRSSLFIGLLFLVACLAASRLLVGSHEGTWATVVRESLSIAGWVAMWRPMEIYLYDWWPLRGRGRIYKKLSQVPIQVVRKGA
jgi:hypothetical protein